MIRRFAARFPGRLAVIHSGLTDAERARRMGPRPLTPTSTSWWARAARSSPPCPGCGVIVVDEEDASAYKQDRIPRYHAVDVALELGRRARGAGGAGQRHPPGGDLLPGPHRRSRADDPRRADHRAGSPPHRGGGSPRGAARRQPKPAVARAWSEPWRSAVAEGGSPSSTSTVGGPPPWCSAASCGEPVGCPHCSVSLVLPRRPGTL